MKKDKTESNREHFMRDQAELKLEKKKVVRPAAESDLNLMYHELTVHQVELEMQNEELRRAQQELEASRNKYADLYDFAPVGYFTLDKKGAILEANLTGASMLGIPRSRLMNQAFSQYVAVSSSDSFNVYFNKVLNNTKRGRCEVQLLKADGTECYAQLEILAIADNNKTSGGFRMIVIDVTERILAEIEKEKLFIELQQAMEDVKKLSGMLPICSSCKKIRDDQGYWKQIEAYITEHSEAEFSHSICPECAKKLYPEFMKDEE
jgi:PAS domain S-box-containing protein